VSPSSIRSQWARRLNGLEAPRASSVSSVRPARATARRRSTTASVLAAVKPGGVSYLGMAFGTEDLIHLLMRIGVSGAGAEMAVRALAGQSEYDICGVIAPPGLASSPGQVRRSRLKAVQDTDTADVREQSLYLKVFERLERGTLPRAPKMVRVGKATHGRTCIVCQRVIRPRQVLNESITDDGLKEFTHTSCLRAWVDVSRSRKGSETVR